MTRNYHNNCYNKAHYKKKKRKAKSHVIKLESDKGFIFFELIKSVKLFIPKINN